MTQTNHAPLAEWERALLDMQADITALAERHLDNEPRDAEIAQEIIDRALVFDMIATNSRMPLSQTGRQLMHKAYFDAATLLHDAYGAEVEV